MRSAGSKFQSTYGKERLKSVMSFFLTEGIRCEQHNSTVALITLLRRVVIVRLCAHVLVYPESALFYCFIHADSRNRVDGGTSVIYPSPINPNEFEQIDWHIKVHFLSQLSSLHHTMHFTELKLFLYQHRSNVNVLNYAGHWESALNIYRASGRVKWLPTHPQSQDDTLN